MIPKTNLNSLLCLIIICCLSVGNAYAQCDAKFTDDGGLDNPYEANSDTTYTFCPDVVGDVVTVTFTFVDIETTTGTGSQDGCWDFLSVYSGSDTSTPLQTTACGELDGDGGTPSVPESLLQAGDFFISNSADGCLTFTFSSDGSVQGQGWVADVSCGPPPACAQPAGLSVSNITENAADLAWASLETSFDIEWGLAGFAPGSGTTVSGVGNPHTLSGLAASTAYDYYVCAICDDGAGGTTTSDCSGPQTFTTGIAPPECGGLFFDTGGPDAGYDASADESYTICPDVAGDVVTITFTFVDLETSTGAGAQGGCFDFLSIYSGSDTSNPLQTTACGELDGDGSVPSDATSLLQAGDFFTSQSADGCLTITFSSDGSVQQDGWAADITCAPPADCPPPSGLTVSNIGGSSADLSWTSSETTFNIEYDTTGFTPGMGTMVNGVSNPHTLTGLSAETSYDYYVCAVCDDGAGGTIISTCTGPQTFTTDVACPAPTTLAVANETETSADLSWTSTETTFDIEWGAAGFTPGTGTTVNGVSNPHTLTGLDAATAYEYYVCAVCDDGSGGTISSECTGPFAFTTALPGPTCTSGVFFDNGGPAATYASSSSDSITICPEVAGDVVTVTFTFVDIETTTGTGSQGGCWDFLSIYNGSSTADTLQMTACGELDGDGGTPSVPESLLQAGDSFTSTSTDGCLTFTFSSDGSAQEQGWEATITCAPPPNCPQPSGAMASNISGSSADLSWTSDETTFNIEWGTTGFTPGSGTTVNGVSNPYTLTGLSAETAYDYYVCAVCDDGAGGTIISTCTGPQTFTTDVACPAPTALAVANETENSADLSWTSTETTFDVEWGAAGFTLGTGTTVNGVSNPHTLTGLDAATAYEYYVCAVCDDGMGGAISSECTGPFAFATATPAPTCTSGLFFDNGGPAAAYASSSSDSITICPELAGDVVTVTFTFVDIETTSGAGSQGGCWDFLSIYNGSGTADTLQMTACGELDGDGGTPSVSESLLQAGDSFISTAADGCLTFTFNSDGSVNEQGWEATITCAPPPSCPAPTALTVANETENSADLSWTSTETTFDIEWGAAGFTPGTGTTVNGVSNPHTLTGLDAATTYEYYVCAVCDGGMGGTTSSECVGPFAFATALPAPTCSSGVFFDNGGPAENYSSNSSDSITICPEVAGDAVTVTFTFVDIETTSGTGSQGGCWDFLSIYNGSSTADTLQMTACGELDGDGGTPSVPESLLQAGDSFTSTSTDGCLTFTFSSDGSAQEQGWEATITCAPSTVEVSGCTDPCATNYNPAATMDDGSCTLPQEPPTACYETATFNTSTCVWDVTGDIPVEPTTECYETAMFNDGTCVWDVTGDQPTIDDGCDLTDDSFDTVNCVAVNTPNCPAGTMYDAANCACTTDPIPGCTDATACNYNPNANTDDASCVFATGCDTCAANGEVMDNPEVGDTCDDGSDNTENDMIQSDCTCAGTPIQGMGCMDTTACNYDPAATIDDGTCTFPSDVCNDNNPFTLNDTVQADCSCEGTYDEGGVPTVSEWGLIILALILLNLGVLYIRQTEMKIEKA